MMPNDHSTEMYVSGNTAHGHGMLQSVAPSFDLKAFRVRKRESQEKFWSRFGVTQSSGSRFETGMLIPTPVAILVKLYVKGTLNDSDLLE
jgi:hypothetical protein